MTTTSAPLVSLRDYQRQAVDAAHAAIARGVRRQLLAMPTGSGKAQPTGEPVLTPTGWRAIGDLRPGDAVIGADGQPTVVVGVYPQGVRPMLRVTFSDGGWTRCDPDHLWAVRTRGQRYDGRTLRRGRTAPPAARVMRAADLLATGLREGEGWRWYVPLVEPVEFAAAAALPMNPYLLGVLLGDGGLSQRHRVTLHTEPALAELIHPLLPAGTDLVWQHADGEHAATYNVGTGGARGNPLREALAALGLMGTRAESKHIPATYLRGRAANRLALLRGLCDTDGSPSGRGADYSTASAALAAGVRELVWSLGGTATHVCRPAHYVRSGVRHEALPSHRLRILLPHGTNPFHYALKAALVGGDGHDVTRRIVAIEEDGEAEAVCIAVEAADQLYVTRDYTVTHNTITFAHLIRELDRPAVVIVHRDELVRQSVDKLGYVLPDERIGVVQGERNEVARVTVASAQTIIRARRLAPLLELPDDRVIVSDEAHHDRAEGRLRAIMALTLPAASLLIGCTATPERGDGLALGIDGLYEAITYEIGLLELIGAGRLAPLTGVRVGTDTVLDGVASRGGEFAEGDLGAVVNTEERNRLVVEAWQRLAGGRRRTVVFAVNVAHARLMAEAFTTAGIRAATVFGETPADERRATLDAFSAGDLPVLVNCMVLTEGYDEPGIDCIVMARPTRQRGLYQQIIGRGARRAEGKSDCLVLDIVDVSRRHRLVTLPTLARSDRDPESAGDGGEGEADDRAEGEVIDLLELAEERARRQQQRLARRTVDVDLLRGSGWTWQKSTDWLHFAPAGRGEWIAVRQAADGWTPYRLSLPTGAWTAEAERLALAPLDFSYAMGVAEGQIERVMMADPGWPALYARGAAWRERVEPPSTRQIDYAARLGIDPEGLSKAELSGRIDAAVFERATRKTRW